MRENAHLLETFNELEQEKVLSLRRHEKDYILRSDTIYVNELNKLASEMTLEINASKSISDSNKATIIQILTNYQTLFNKMVSLDTKIGINNRGGLHLELLLINDKIESLLDQIRLQMNEKKTVLIKEIEFAYIFTSVLLIVASFIISFLVAQKITKPLLAFTNSIKGLVESNFEKKLAINLKGKQREITVLASEFDNMTRQLQQREKDRQAALEELHESELKFSNLANMLPQSIFEVDQSGVLTYCNKALKDQFLYTDEDIDNGILLSQLAQFGDNNNPSYFEDNEIIAQRKDTSTFHALFYMNPIIYKDKVEGYRGLIIDISDRKEYMAQLKKEKDKAEESDKLKSAFLANMSHEIRTPMNAIIGFSDLLTDENLSLEDRREFVSYINSNGASLLKLIDDIIDIAKIESGHISIHKTSTNLGFMFSEIESSINEIRKQYCKDQVQLINESNDDSIEDLIMTDPHRLRQVLINLLTNAVKFTETGSIRFGYRVEKKSSRIYFFVEDTGIGIPSEKLDVVFERFRKIYESTTSNYSGTGLGLYISKTIVSLLGGDIWVESVEGKGSMFQFYIEYESAEIKSQETIKPETLNDIDISGLKILVAEDKEFNYMLLKNLLKKMGANVYWAKNGVEVLDFFFDKKEADIILMDINMPELNGYETIQKMKKLYPQIPVIVQTASAMAGEREKSISIGADDYIAKPINNLELVVKIFSLTRQKVKIT